MGASAEQEEVAQREYGGKRCVNKWPKLDTSVTKTIAH